MLVTRLILPPAVIWEGAVTTNSPSGSATHMPGVVTLAGADGADGAAGAEILPAIPKTDRWVTFAKMYPSSVLTPQYCMPAIPRVGFRGQAYPMKPSTANVAAVISSMSIVPSPSESSVIPSFQSVPLYHWIRSEDSGYPPRLLLS